MVVERLYYSYTQRYAVHEVVAIKTEHTHHQNRRLMKDEANPVQQAYPMFESILQSVLDVNANTKDIKPLFLM